MGVTQSTISLVGLSFLQAQTECILHTSIPIFDSLRSCDGVTHLIESSKHGQDHVPLREAGYFLPPWGHLEDSGNYHFIYHTSYLKISSPISSIRWSQLDLSEPIADGRTKYWGSPTAKNYYAPEEKSLVEQNRAWKELMRVMRYSTLSI